MGTTGIEPFQTTFAVPLHCDDCVRDVSGALSKMTGIKDPIATTYMGLR